MGRHLLIMDWVTQLSKMSVLPKLIYRFNVLSNQHPSVLFLFYRQTYSKNL